MNRSIETRLDRLVEARQERDAATVKATITTFLWGLTPETLYECREPDALRPHLAAFLADQPAPTIGAIERWSKAKKGKR